MTKEQHDCVFRQFLIMNNIRDISQSRLNRHWQHAIYEGLDYLDPLELKDFLEHRWKNRILKKSL